MNDIQISNNFNLKEFVCTGSGPLHDHVQLDKELLNRLQKLRDAVGKPIIITSAYRCPERNRQVGGATKSQHLYGKAADIRCIGLTSRQLAAEAEKIGFGGIGIYNTFVHVDTRNGKARWDKQ